MARSYVAGGNVNPCVFVKYSGEHTVIQCTGSADEPIGISQEGTDAAPLDGASTYAAVSGEPLMVHCPFEPGGDERVLLVAGTGGWTYGQNLVSDANGNGVPVSTGLTFTAIQWVGAIADTSTTAALKGEVYPVLFPYRASLS
ncbi:MAG: hypothetical protein ACREQ5_03240 [Candidatus Dormibacteria bacterium]